MIQQTQLIGLTGENIVYDILHVINKADQSNKALINIKGMQASYKDTLIIESLSSATIEGARTTVDNVIKNFENPKDKSEKMVVNNVKALKMIYDGFTINDDTIRNLWEVLTHDACENSNIAGRKYRNGKVYAGNNTEIIHVPCDVNSIQKHMNMLFNYIQNSNEGAVIKAAVTHFYLVYIHPFCDGNGRMARLLINYILYNYGYTDVKKLSISKQISNNIGSYYKSLKNSEKSSSKAGKHMIDITEHIVYILDMVVQACKELEAKHFKLSDNEAKLINKMKKHGVGAEITVAKTEKLLGLSNSGARAVLNRLVDKGILAKQLRDNKMIYILKIRV